MVGLHFRVRLSRSVAFVLLVAGCTQQGTTGIDQGTPRPSMRVMSQAVEQQEALSDERIGREVRRRLDADPGAMAGVIIEVEDGIVTLRGAAENVATAWRAEAAARSVLGVKDVRNHILISNVIVR